MRLAKLALRPGAGNLVNGILRKLILLKVATCLKSHAPVESVIKRQEFDISCMNMQEKNSLPLPKVEGDDRTQARALATHYSHPVVSL